MKKVLSVCVLSAFLCSCSLLQRHMEDESPETEEVAEKTESAPPLEEEVAKLHTKVSALETKLDVLSAGMERMQLTKSQPVIEAESAPAPQPNMAAPVDVPAAPAVVSAAPVRPQELPAMEKNAGPSSETEREFRAAMTLFQSGRNMEASSRFAMISKKYPQHLLASHSLYWAGESAARGQQWSMAIENWEELENKYPRSAYLPESLAGLARAYEQQGNTGKARAYRETLVRAFPKSPVAMNFHESKPAAAAASEPAAPAYEDEGSGGSEQGEEE